MSTDQPAPEDEAPEQEAPEQVEPLDAPEQFDFGITSTGREKARKMFETAGQALERKNYGYAVSMLRQAVRLTPDESRYRQALRATNRKLFTEGGGRPKFAVGFLFWPKCWIAQLKKDWRGLIEICEDMLVKNPWHRAAQRALGEGLYQTGLVADAVWTLQNVVQEKPNHVGSLRQLGRYQAANGDYNDAVRAWQKICELRPNDRDAETMVKNLSAHETIQRAHLEEADSFTDSVRDQSETQRLLDEERVLKSADQVQARIRELEIELDAAPGNVNVYFSLADLYLQLGQPDEAEGVLRQAEEKAGAGFEAHIRLADIQIDRLQRAVNDARESLAGDPGNKELKALHKKAKKTLLAFEMDEYRQRVERYPTELNWRFHYGRRLLAAGQHQEAVGELQRARHDPKHRPQALQLLGRSFFYLGNTELALSHLQDALKALPAGADEWRKAIHYELLRVAENVGNQDLYVENLNAVAAMDFGYRDVAQRVQRLGEGKSQVASTGDEDAED